MKWKYIAKEVFRNLAVLTFTFFGSIGVLDTTHAVYRGLIASENAVVEWVATYGGFEKKAPPEPVLTVNEIIQREARKRQINPALLRSLMREESGGNVDVMSHAGAIGLMQIMPANAPRCKLAVKDLFDSEKNIQCGAQILDEELRTYKNDPRKAVQAYNGGPRCVGKCSESIRHEDKVFRGFSRDIS